MRNVVYVLVFVSFCFLLHVSAQFTHPAEVDALHTVKTTLDDPTGSLENWSKGDPCTSNWTGVWCSDRVASDGFYHIKELQLLNMNLAGNLAPELGELSHLEELNFMWNQITGAIPKEIGKLSSLKILVLNGNRLSGSLPDELGFLSNMNRLQLDENSLSGPIPKSFANMKSMEHFHLNNNLFSGKLPPELSRINSLIHLLMDNNNLSGKLPPQFSALSKLQILQLDNNNFVGAEVPESYQNLPELVKLSLRNCSLGGALPDLSQMPSLSYIDLSWNDLTGSLPSNKLSDNITTINLSHNKLSGPLPESFSFLPLLQLLSLENNSLNGSVPAGLWNKSLSSSDRLSIDLRYNFLSDISGDLNPPQNVTLRLQGNPVCDASIQRINDFCDSDAGRNLTTDGVTSSAACSDATCSVEHNFEPIPDTPTCICAAPIQIGYRLKSPSFTYFPPYMSAFVSYITNALNMEPYQLFIESYAMEAGPRLRMNLKHFPNINASNGRHIFTNSELHWISSMYHGWDFPGSKLFGPYELLNFTLLGPYSSADLQPGGSGSNKAFPIPAMIGVIICAITVFVAAIIFILKMSNRCPRWLRRFMPKHTSIKIDGVKEFTYHDMSRATNNFNSSTQVGEGGYGKVYKGILPDDTVVAVKRAQEGSFQGTHEFLTEIHLLSRLHHRNLVSLVGYCSEHGEQMLVYEFMPNGTLQDWLSGKLDKTLGYTTRLSIALGAAKGILYLHREANPPVFHRDIKASNILLDSNMIAKVADFGLSRLAPSLDDKDDVPGGHVSTAVKGTPGYLDPEYFLTRKMTDKSDVYSLGVVFLELLTSLPPILNGKNLVREVNIAHESGSLFNFIDSRMILPSWECVERFMDLARGCCQNKPEKRPSMSDVVRELENIIQMLPESVDNMPYTTPVELTSASTSQPRAYPNASADVSGRNSVTGITSDFAPR